MTAYYRKLSQRSFDGSWKETVVPIAYSTLVEAVAAEAEQSKIYQAEEANEVKGDYSEVKVEFVTHPGYLSLALVTYWVSATRGSMKNWERRPSFAQKELITAFALQEDVSFKVAYAAVKAQMDADDAASALMQATRLALKL